MENTRTIYILLTQPKTVFSRAIKLYTRAAYNHVSISLDERLEEVYSFGRKVYWNPLYAGFVKEDVYGGVFAYSSNTKSSLYALTVTKTQYESLLKNINKFKQNKELYRYNFLGILGVVLNKPIEGKNRYFCSHFVAAILEYSGIKLFDRPAALIRPQDFAECTQLKLVYSGDLSRYMPALAFNI